MSRSVPPWSSDNHDAAIPPRVRLRVFERADGCCEMCGRKLSPADMWQADHIIPLALGGAHSEVNLQCLCDWCHAGKTKKDAAAKSKSAKVRARHLGVKTTSRPIPGSKASGFKRKMNGEVVKR